MDHITSDPDGLRAQGMILNHLIPSEANPVTELVCSLGQAGSGYTALGRSVSSQGLQFLIYNMGDLSTIVSSFSVILQN